MHKKTSKLSTYILFLIGAVATYFFFQTSLSRPVGALFSSVGRQIAGFSFSLVRFNKSPAASSISRLKLENIELRRKLTRLELLKRENNALRDQFETQYPKSSNLIPSRIVGMKSFVPGISHPSRFILDKGSSDGVAMGQAVVFKDNLVGKVGAVERNLSDIVLVTDQKFSLTAKILKRSAIGVVKGQGNDELMLDGVLLSETVEKGDVVLSKGDEVLSGIGIPPDLIVGIVDSVEKKPSALFQTARVKPMLNFFSLEEVFVVHGVTSNE